MALTDFADLFVGLNVGASDETTRGLWDRLEPLRSKSPILTGLGGRFPDFPDLPNMWMASADDPTFLVMSWEGVGEVLRDSRRFSSSANLAYELLFGRTIVNMDDPDHSRYRALVMPAFRKTTMDSWQVNHIEPVVERVLAGLRGERRVDLLSAYVFPVPYMVTAGVLGLSPGIEHEVTRAVNTILSFSTDLGAALTAAQTLRDLMADVVAARRRDPGDDVVSSLLTSEVDGERLDDEAVVSFLRLLGPAAMDTTYRSTSILLFALLSDPEALDRVRTDPAVLDLAVEEALRWEAVGPFVLRKATAPASIHGVDIPEGSLVLACAAMANRDPNRWTEPHQFRVDRPFTPHWTFSGGAHTCLGAHLAKQTMKHAVRCLVEEFPDLCLDDEAPRPFVNGLLLRAASALPVVLNR